MFNNQLWEPIYNFKYTGHPEEFTLPPDTYLFIANGARGGTDSNSDGNAFISWGGTTYGILDLDHTQTFYAVVGGPGESTNTGVVRPAGGYNGGGSGGLSGDGSRYNGAGGGGASDIRLSNEPDTTTDVPATIPDNWNQCEWLAAYWNGIDCGGYIISDYIFKAKSKIEIVFEAPEGFGHGAFENNLFGCYSTEQYVDGGQTRTRSVKQFSFELGVSTGHSNNWWFSCGDKTYSSENPPPAERIYLPDLTKMKLIVEPYSSTVSIYNNDDNDALIGSATVDSERVDCEYPLFFLQKNCSGTPERLQNSIVPSSLIIYYIKIWEDNQLVRWYVPFASTLPWVSPDVGHQPGSTQYGINRRDPNEDRGLYDLVNKNFFYRNPCNPSYWFNVGPVVPKESYGTTKVVTDKPSLRTRILVAGGGGGTSIMFKTKDKVQDFLTFGGGPTSSAIYGSNITAENNAGKRAKQNDGYAFGIGQDAQDRDFYYGTKSYYNTEGQGGGGGGWYGGYAVQNKTSCDCDNGNDNTYTAYGGTGGSCYLLTSSSYKPEHYLEGYEDIIPTLYFDSASKMFPYQAFDFETFNGGSVDIYKPMESIPMSGDKIIVPYTGIWQTWRLFPSKYKIECYGGSGATRYDYDDSAKGGYVSGVLNLEESTQFFFHVGYDSTIHAVQFDSANQRSAVWNGTSPFQVSANTSYPDMRRTATTCGGSTDMRLEQTGNVPAIITIPDGSDEVEYLESDGTQYLNNGSWLNIRSYDAIDCVCEITANTGDKQALFGRLSNYTSSQEGFALFLIYDTENPKVTFVCGDDIATTDDVIPLNQKIRITVIDNVVSWYDMEGNLLGSVTSTGTRPSYSYIFLFNCADKGSGNTPIAGSHMRLYSFKVTSTIGTMSDSLFFLPFADQTNPTTTNGLYEFVGKRQLKKGSLGNAFTYGSIVDPKTGYSGTINNTTRSRLSRIIVAGGGGGQGSPYGYGGEGGGYSGGWPSGGSGGSNSGPGTQSTGASFETGGQGSTTDKRFVGNGGYGWYGGYATTNGLENNDTNKGGSGGSGYVLTESSIKPTNYIPDERYWMTDTVLETGGNTTKGRTCIELSVLETPASLFSVIAGDDESYKAYDTEHDTWYDITVDTLTPGVFETYGVSIDEITTDEGLTFPYNLYVCDTMSTGVKKIYAYVVPPIQHVILKDTYSIYKVLGSSIDGDYDKNNVSTSIDTSFDENNYLVSDMSINMTDIPNRATSIYMIQHCVKYRSGTKYEMPPLEKISDTIVLYPTMSESTYSSDYKAWNIQSNPVTVSSSSCEYNRCIYSLIVVNNSTLSIVKYNMRTNTFEEILSGVTVGTISSSASIGMTMLIKDGKLYCGNSFMNVMTAPVIMIEVPLNDPSQYHQYSSYSLSQDGQRENAYGQSYWYSDNEIIFSVMKGFMLFNTTTHSWAYKEDTDIGSTLPIYSFGCGDHSIISFPYNDDGSCLVYNKYTFTRVNTSLAFSGGRKCCTYYNGKFYITMSRYLYIITDKADHNLTINQTINTPYTTLQPKTISVTDNLIYVTFEESDILYGYDISTQRWFQITLPFTVPTTGNKGWYRPTCCDGYFFIAYDGLFVTNPNTYHKYNIGERNTYIHIPTDSSYDKPITYDNRFISIDSQGTHIHAGYIDKQLSVIDETNHILKSQDFLSTDYNRLINYSFTIN